MNLQRAEERVRVLVLVVAAMFAVLGLRLWFLQVLTDDAARAAARDNAIRVLPVAAPRGRILDVDGNVLVDNRGSLQVQVDRQELGGDAERVLLELSTVLGVDATELGVRLQDPAYYAFAPVPIADDITPEQAYWIEERAPLLPGVEVVSVPVRRYQPTPLGEVVAPHVVGYLGQVSPEQLADPAFVEYRAGDEVGQAGVEAAYERDLRGREGFVSVRVDARGRTIEPVGRREPVAGADLRLTLESVVQIAAQDALRFGIEHARTVYDPNTLKNLKATGGSAIVIDPTTGAIRALASFPTFDPTAFTRPIPTRRFEELFGEGAGYPLLNRGLQGQYPPASTYKPWILLSALGRDVVDTSRGYDCPPYWNVPGDTRIFRNWTSADRGTMTLATALSESCDTVFYPMGYEYWRFYYPPPWLDGVEGNDEEPPIEPLQRDLRGAGFGDRTGIDLPSELPGRVPDAVWKLSIHDRLPEQFPYGDWVPGDFVNMSIGQGDTLVTPLQLAMAYAGLQNGGRLCRPHVVASVQRASGRILRETEPRCRARLPFGRADLQYVRDALEETVRYGTAAAAFAGFPFDRVWVSGKTGTAQVFGSQDYSWFAAMTESGGRSAVIVVLVEQGGHGSTTAAPIARRIIEAIYGLDLTAYTDVAGTD